MNVDIGTASTKAVLPTSVRIISSIINSLFKFTQSGMLSLRLKIRKRGSDAPAYARTSVFTSEAMCSLPTLMPRL